MPSTSLAAQIRPHFPALRPRLAARPTAFFDAPAGSQVPLPVIEAVAQYLTRQNANTGGAFRTSTATDEMIWGARERMADFLGAGSPGEIVFGANMTSLTYSLSRALVDAWSPGDELVVTELDHLANVAPWRRVAHERGLRVRTVPFFPDTCTLDLAALEASIGPRTRLVAVGYASNAVGTINDVQRVARLAQEVGALCFVDAVHYAPHRPINVQEIGCDFLACSAYKFYGPHVGVLWGNQEHLEHFPPVKVPPAPDTVPERWETGTLSHEGIAGTAAAVDWIAALAPAEDGDGRRARLQRGMQTIERYEMSLLPKLLASLEQIDGVRIFGPPPGTPRTPTVAFTVEGYTPRQIAERLAEEEIYVWDGDFYASTVIERLGLARSGGVVRAGLAPYVAEEDVERLLEALELLVERRA